jgi:hypothetical protein
VKRVVICARRASKFTTGRGTSLDFVEIAGGNSPPAPFFCLPSFCLRASGVAELFAGWMERRGRGRRNCPALRLFRPTFHFSAFHFSALSVGACWPASSWKERRGRRCRNCPAVVPAYAIGAQFGAKMAESWRDLSQNLGLPPGGKAAFSRSFCSAAGRDTPRRAEICDKTKRGRLEIAA